LPMQELITLGVYTLTRHIFSSSTSCRISCSGARHGHLFRSCNGNLFFVSLIGLTSLSAVAK
jgi:hypothetical protein